MLYKVSAPAVSDHWDQSYKFGPIDCLPTRLVVTTLGSRSGDPPGVVRTRYGEFDGRGRCATQIHLWLMQRGGQPVSVSKHTLVGEPATGVVELSRPLNRDGSGGEGRGGAGRVGRHDAVH